MIESQIQAGRHSQNDSVQWSGKRIIECRSGRTARPRRIHTRYITCIEIDGSVFFPPFQWALFPCHGQETQASRGERASIDMILGRTFIIDRELFVFADLVFVIDLTWSAPLPKGK